MLGYELLLALDDIINPIVSMILDFNVGESDNGTVSASSAGQALYQYVSGRFVW